MNLISSTIGEKIKEQRKKLGITQPELAKGLELSLDMIKKLETNRREPSIETLKKLSEYFNVPIDYIVGNTNLTNQNEYNLYKYSYIALNAATELVNHNLTQAFETILFFLTIDGEIYKPFREDVVKVAKIFGHETKEDFFKSPDELRVLFYSTEKIDILKMLYEFFYLLRRPHQEYVDNYLENLAYVQIKAIDREDYTDSYRESVESDPNYPDPFKPYFEKVKFVITPKSDYSLDLTIKKLKKSSDFLNKFYNTSEFDLVRVYEQMRKNNDYYQ
jgi:transcriptional regulator with XRE-family HTH domain